MEIFSKHLSLIHCRRLNSTGEEDDDDEDIGVDECPSATSSSNSSVPASPLPANFNFEEHYTYLAARERLQEFPGQVPQKKKKVVSEEKAEAVAVKTQKKPKSKVSRNNNKFLSVGRGEKKNLFVEIWRPFCNIVSTCAIQ